ncbi:acylphosphatase [Mitsuokella jalaludinii]|uniref:acylphosphatase n=3 Tax=Mitsuokella jalaludinii TaxID=187979 RepID=A0A173XER7_9FIRM|nr:acylphosphatase [Mitsuokella jalaludinii]MCI6610903.1 acylphosphatase [Mitsuokella jalaludinii]MCQ1532873.1 acylphosphatase [Mitsuokella jalaludinii]MDD7745119.1 acylphosphatase [Mitsuokella jalaludinii]CUN50173.1 Acylphosphatase [Mitsuokella jalaludinii]
MAESKTSVRYFGRATGRVQGVGFRMFVQQHASELGLTGWVRNMEDGSVEMEIQGDPEKVDKLSVLIREGNYFIKVKELKFEPVETVPNETRFVVRY